MVPTKSIAPPSRLHRSATERQEPPAASSFRQPVRRPSHLRQARSVPMNSTQVLPLRQRLLLSVASLSAPKGELRRGSFSLQPALAPPISCKPKVPRTQFCQPSSQAVPKARCSAYFAARYRLVDSPGTGSELIFDTIRRCRFVRRLCRGLRCARVRIRIRRRRFRRNRRGSGRRFRSRG